MELRLDPISSVELGDDGYVARVIEKPRHPRELRRDLSPYLEWIVLRCLERERSFRYADIGGLLADLEAKQATRVTGRRLMARLRSKATLTALVAIVAVLAIAGVVLLLERALGGGGAGAGSPLPGVAILPFENGTGDAALDWTRSGLPASSVTIARPWPKGLS